MPWSSIQPSGRFSGQTARISIPRHSTIGPSTEMNCSRWPASGARHQSPFAARCMERRAISPLLLGDEVEVVSMAPADECSHEMFVMIRWEHGGLCVPLSQLEPSGASAGTEVAVADWCYWVGQGYQL